jgi:hypothetical protein
VVPPATASCASVRASDQRRTPRGGPEQLPRKLIKNDDLRPGDPSASSASARLRRALPPHASQRLFSDQRVELGFRAKPILMAVVHKPEIPARRRRSS